MSFRAPSTLPAGLTVLTFVNADTGLHAALIRNADGTFVSEVYGLGEGETSATDQLISDYYASAAFDRRTVADHLKGKIWVVAQDGSTKRIDETELAAYEAQGYVRGKKLDKVAKAPLKGTAGAGLVMVHRIVDGVTERTKVTPAVAEDMYAQGWTKGGGAYGPRQPKAEAEATVAPVASEPVTEAPAPAAE